MTHRSHHGACKRLHEFALTRNAINRPRGSGGTGAFPSRFLLPARTIQQRATLRPQLLRAVYETSMPWKRARHVAPANTNGDLGRRLHWCVRLTGWLSSFATPREEQSD